MTVQHVTVSSIVVPPDGFKKNELLSLIPNSQFHQREYPFILYWASWLDPWLSGYDYENIPRTRPVVRPKWLSDNLGVISPNGTITARLKQSLRRRFQYPEQRWLNTHLLEACQVHDKLKVKRIVCIRRNVVDAVVDDIELRTMIKRWLTNR